jgi:hypothetical protein
LLISAVHFQGKIQTGLLDSWDNIVEVSTKYTKNVSKHQLLDRRILSVEGMFVKIFEISTPY